MKKAVTKPSPLILGLSLAIVSSISLPREAIASTGKLVLTGGVSTIEGAAGGGISPWALIGTQATDGEMGFSANLTQAEIKDYSLSTYGVAFAAYDKIEFSLAQQRLDAGKAGAPLGLPGLTLTQDVFGVKYRLAGEAILDSDRWMPQISLGVQHKRLDAEGLAPTLRSLGSSLEGTDVYLSATKLFLKPGILVNGTLRATKANQNGLLGFGSTLGGANDSYELMPELSVAKLIRRDLAVGFEYRAMPNNLERAGQAAGLGNGLAADDWFDVFVAWAPTKQFSLTAAYLDLGRIVPGTTGNRDQTGVYLSAQYAF